MKQIISSSLFESAGFIAGTFIGFTVGFMVGYAYVLMPWGVP